MITTCKCCSIEFNVKPSWIRKGFGKFCSIKCRDFREPNQICALCKQSFYQPPSKTNRSKSGLVFCCRDHKDKAQRLSNGLSQIHPSHYRTGSYIDYRKLAFDTYGAKCNKCNYDTNVHALEVHHIDKNRTNNHITNLKVLCANCHRITHHH